MGVLNENVSYIPTLKDISKEVPTTKKGNIPFNKANLAAIILASVPMTWQNQHNLTHLMVPKLPRTLLLDLENIKQVMVEKHNEKLKAKGKASTDPPDAKSNLKRNTSGGSGDQVLKKAHSEKFGQHCKPTAALTRCAILVTAIAMTRMASPSEQPQVSPPSPQSPTRNLGMIRVWPLCRPCLRLMQKPRKLVSLSNTGSVTMTLVTFLTVNRELGATTQDFV
jgi:hypothetical protein